MDRFTRAFPSFLPSFLLRHLLACTRGLYLSMMYATMQPRGRLSAPVVTGSALPRRHSSNSKRPIGLRMNTAASTKNAAENESAAARPSANSANAACDLGQRLLVNTELSLSSFLVVTLLAVGFLATAGDASFASAGESATTASPTAVEYFSLAENEDFWANVLRYVSYFFSVLLGTAYVAFKPIVALLKRPTTAILVIAAFAGLYYFVSTTVKAMIGVDEFVYEPSSIVTPYLQ